MGLGSKEIHEIRKDMFIMVFDMKKACFPAPYG